MQTSKTRLIHKALLTLVLTSLCTGLPMTTSHAVPTSSAGGERIKDIAHIRGVRSNQLFGYGIVVGLNRTGDSQQVRFATQTVASLLARLNVRISPQGLLLRNIATVMITADLPPFAKNGNRIDTVVSSMGDAKSLSGGTLIATALRGHDGKIYAMAQGPLSVGGYSISGGGGNSKILNHPTVARIPGGAIVENEIPFSLKDNQSLKWQLYESDFTTAVRVAQEINYHFARDIAAAEDSRTINVRIPKDEESSDDEAQAAILEQGRVARFIAQVERIPVIPDSIAKVIINERTGTVIINQDVRVDPVAITHGNITVKVQVDNQVIPATPLTNAPATTQTNTSLEVEEERVNLALFEKGQSLQDLVDGLNQLGASPRDLITILQSIKKAGALRAKLEVL
ncbi:MAG: flagellar biosynthesis protein FlgA [Myxococcales bacterium]|nr:flagellar biosynthesis protein FlgA [Myxococcales bacterium]